jgi:hypothetical protein
MRGVVWNIQQRIQQFSFEKCGCTMSDANFLFIHHPKSLNAIFTIHLDLMVQGIVFQMMLAHVFRGKMLCHDKSCA